MMKEKLSVALISFLVMVFSLNYGWADNVDDLINQLKDEEPLVRRKAAFKLGITGDERAVEPLMAALKDKDANVRISAAEGLTRIVRKATDTKFLLPSMKSLIAALEDIHISSFAALALEKIGEPAAEPLIEVLKDQNRNPIARFIAAFVLGRSGDKSGIDAAVALMIGEFMNDPLFRAMFRSGAIFGSLQFDVELAVEPLVAALKDQNIYVRRNATLALGQIARKSADPKLLQFLVDLLISDLKDRDADVRRNAVLVLGEIGEAKAIEPLISALKDQDVYVRGNAAVALGEIAKKAADTKLLQPAVELLIAALRDRDTNVRRNAVEALRKIAENVDDPKFLQPAVEPLIAVLKGQDIGYDRYDLNLIASIAETLGKIDKRSLEVTAMLAINALKVQDIDVRTNATIILIQIAKKFLI